MSGSIPYLGSKISLITTSDIRYEGILHTLNREESTIAVQNVRSFGTEGRRRPEVPVSNEIYDFIIFRGKDLVDLTVLQASPERPPTNSLGVASEFHDSHGGSMYNHAATSSDVGVGYSDSTYTQVHPASMSSYQRPAPMNSSIGNVPVPVPRNGAYQAPATNSLLSSSYCAGGYAAPTSASSRPSEKVLAAGAVHSRPAMVSAPAEPLVPAPASSSSGAQAVYDDGNGLESSRGAPEDAKSVAPRAPGDLKVPPRTDDSKEREDQKRGRGKGGGQKKTLAEVLRFHQRAQDLIVKAMRQQNSSNLSPSELRAMSESNPTVYHFCLDFVNYCCQSHTVSSDEQQWDMLSRALKKHFEKDFGSGQAHKPPQPQRPNNTLGDFITMEASSKSGKKPAKVTRGAAASRVGRGTASKKDYAADSGELNNNGPDSLDDSSAQSASWACPRCTLRNENFLLECAACGTSKQQAALWAEFPPLG